MSQELHYTSASRGLKPGTKGFCTVAATSHMVPRLVELLEGLSGYRAVYSPNDPKAGLNPTVYLHLSVPIAGKRQHVISRVAAAGVDHTSRSNVYAHHLVIDPSERPEGGPAWLLLQPGVIDQSFDGEPRLLPAGREVPKGGRTASICSAWQALAGDAGWAGVVAESLRSHPQRVINLIFEPGQELLPLLDEALALLPPSKRWEVNFCSYYTALPPDVTCTIRGVLDGSEQADFARRRLHDALTIDLTRPQAAATGGELVEAARTGVLPHRPVAEPPSSPEQPANRMIAAKPDRERKSSAGSTAPLPGPTPPRPDLGGGYGVAPPPLPSKPFPTAAPPPLGTSSGTRTESGFDWKNPPLLIALGFLMGVAVTAAVGLLLLPSNAVDPVPVEVVSNPRPTTNESVPHRPDRILPRVDLPRKDSAPPTPNDPTLDPSKSDLAPDSDEPLVTQPPKSDEKKDEETHPDMPLPLPSQVTPEESLSPSVGSNGKTTTSTDPLETEDQPFDPTEDNTKVNSPVTARSESPFPSQATPTAVSTPIRIPDPRPDTKGVAPSDQKIKVRLLRSPLPEFDKTKWEVLEVDGIIPADAIVATISTPVSAPLVIQPPSPEAAGEETKISFPGSPPIPLAEVRLGENGPEFRWLSPTRIPNGGRELQMQQVRDSVISLKGKDGESVSFLLRSQVDLPEVTFQPLKSDQLRDQDVWSVGEAKAQGKTQLPMKILALRGVFKNAPDSPSPLIWSRDSAEGDPALNLPELQGKPQPPLVLQFSTPAEAKDQKFVLKRSIHLGSGGQATLNAAREYQSKLGEATFEVSVIFGVEVESVAGGEKTLVEILRLGEWPDEG